MGSYVPNTKKEQEEMLRAAGFSSFDRLYDDIPADVRLNRELKLPSGLSEMEVRSSLEETGKKNHVFPHIFRGAGAYRHYIPAFVKSTVSKEAFVTAYTPYQAEISQGLLQSIFEYQTMICSLTGMDVSNASVYDGAAAAAEAVAMCRERKRDTAYVSAAVQPQALSVIRTYCVGNGIKLVLVREKDGRTDLEALDALPEEAFACFYVQQPNFYGCLEDCSAIARIVHNKGGKLILGCNPISLGILKSPGDYGADIAVGEGQPLGMPLSFGGPYLGFMAARKELMRRLPGRIVGQTADIDGKRGFVLTLQAREQHIRREKASSNICSNQALCAMTAAAYLAVMGARGLARAAESCMAKAHYLQEQLENAGCRRVHQGPYFHEFVTVCPPGLSSPQILKALEKQDFLGGLPLDDSRILWCATEMNTKTEIDQLVQIIKEVAEA